MPSNTETPTSEEISAATLAELIRYGYLRDDGKVDMKMIDQRLAELLDERKVTTKENRRTRALSRGDLATYIFPDTPGHRDAFDETDNPVLAEKVYERLRDRIWRQTVPGAASTLQQVVAERMGNGFVICRVKLTNDNVEKVYITDNYGLINTDFIASDKRALTKAMNKSVANRAMLMRLRPYDVAKIEKVSLENYKGIQEDGATRIGIAAADARAVLEADNGPQDTGDEAESGTGTSES